MAEIGGSESDNDSRTAAFATATKSNATSTANSSPRSTGGTKKSKRSTKRTQGSRDFVPMGATFFQSAEYLEPTNSAELSSPDEPRPVNPDSSNMDVDLGKNRLSTGFRSQLASTTAIPTVGSPGTTASESGSKDEPIEVLSSDESMADSDDGGMVVNIEDPTNQAQEEDHMGSDSHEEGEVSSSPGALEQVSTDSLASTLPSKLKLEDLCAEDLELQVKYTLFHLDRSQIDLNRPVTCLSCLEQGHLAADCPETKCEQCSTQDVHSTRRCPQRFRCSRCRQPGHASDTCDSDLRVTTVPCELCGTLGHSESACCQRFFPSTSLKPAKGGPVRLWVSCCICASKSHLVGDCPKAVDQAASRWSLKGLAPIGFVNMSLESGMRSREVAAENRNMRPNGLQIKGRAGLHHAGHGSSAPASDDEEGFVRPPIHSRKDPRGPPQFRFGAASSRAGDSDRYNRSDPATGRGPRGDWYATDSFGRRRSRSPGATLADQWRPDDSTPPSPRRFDNRNQMRARSPPRGYASTDSYRPNAGPPSNPQNNTRPSRPQGGQNVPTAAVSLPTRKGSNPSLPKKPASNVQTNQGQPKKQKPANSGGSGKKRGKKANAKAS